MRACRKKIFASRVGASLVVLLILLVPMAIGTPAASARTLCTPQNRAGENFVAAALLRVAQSSQTPDLQLENPSGQRKSSQDDDHLAQVGTLVASTPASVPAMIGGAALAANGAENMRAGLQGLWSGQPTETYTQQAIAAATGSSTAGIWGNVAIGMMGGNWEEAGALVPVEPYEVGTYNQLARRSVGDGLDIHHVGQGNPMAQIIPNYDYGAAPAIAIPSAMHLEIPRIVGTYD